MPWSTPDATRTEALQDLLAGNARFVAGTPRHPNQDAPHRVLLSDGQAPKAAVLGCSDSRASVELLFDQGFGDVFVIRNAGHVLGRSTQASVEFAVQVLQVDVVFVLGHESCGAVGATVSFIEEGTELPGEMPILVELVQPHLTGARPADDPVALHVCGTIEDLLQDSPMVRAALDRGEVAVAGGVYGLRDGAVNLVWTQDGGRHLG